MDEQNEKDEKLVLATTASFAATLRAFCKEHRVSQVKLVLEAGRAALNAEPRPPLSSQDVGTRTTEVHVRIDPRVKQIFAETAEDEGLSLSRWMESALLHEMRSRLVVAELDAKAKLASIRLQLSSLKVEVLEREYEALRSAE